MITNKELISATKELISTCPTAQNILSKQLVITRLALESLVSSSFRTYDSPASNSSLYTYHQKLAYALDKLDNNFSLAGQSIPKQTLNCLNLAARQLIINWGVRSVEINEKQLIKANLLCLMLDRMVYKDQLVPRKSGILSGELYKLLLLVSVLVALDNKELDSKLGHAFLSIITPMHCQQLNESFNKEI